MTRQMLIAISCLALMTLSGCEDRSKDVKTKSQDNLFSRVMSSSKNYFFDPDAKTCIAVVDAGHKNSFSYIVPCENVMDHFSKETQEIAKRALAQMKPPRCDCGRGVPELH